MPSATSGGFERPSIYCKVKIHVFTLKRPVRFMTLAAPNNPAHAATILVVDDERRIAQVVTDHIRLYKYDVLTCYSGTEALKIVEKRAVDLVVLDVLMPDIDGFSVAKKMKSFFGIDNFVPIIMLTALSDTENRITGLENADDIISKPFSPKELIARINALLRIRNLQHELLLSKRRYQFLYDNAPYMYVSINDAKNISDCNALFCANIGLTKQEIVGTGFMSLFKREDQAALDAFIRSLPIPSNASDSPVLTMVPLTGASAPIHVALSSVPESGDLQRPDRVIVMQDISHNIRLEQEQRNARMQMYRSARLASIGTLASGVAHELNNPLTAILGFSSALLGRVKEEEIDKEELSQYLSIINSETLRCRDIIENLSKFSRDGEVNIQDFSLLECVEGALKLISPKAAKKNITITSDVPASWIAHADMHKLEQIIIHVITNCLDFCDKGSLIAVSAEVDDQSIRLAIADNGPGIPGDILPKVFDPFFTTKEVGQGAGLGLAISHHIIEECNGTLDISSELGKGTTVTLEIPRNSQE